MKITHSNKKFSSILYLVITSWFTSTCNGQKERFSRWDLDADFEMMKNFDGDAILPERTLCPSSNSIEDCEDDNFYMQFRKRQPTPNAALTSAMIAAKADKTIRTAPFFQTSPFSCSCDMEHRILDLGLLYYPRYIPTAVCKPGGCQGGPFRCHPKKYKIKVLKQKQAENKESQEASSPGLPPNLKELFVSESVAVTVACECRP